MFSGVVQLHCIWCCCCILIQCFLYQLFKNHFELRTILTLCCPQQNMEIPVLQSLYIETPENPTFEKMHDPIILRLYECFTILAASIEFLNFVLIVLKMILKKSSFKNILVNVLCIFAFNCVVC